MEGQGGKVWERECEKERKWKERERGRGRREREREKGKGGGRTVCENLGRKHEPRETDTY